MYKADELTEETEEIILKRQRYWVEQAKFGLKTAELARDRLKRLSIPRQQEMDQYACETSELALAKAANALALGLAEKRYALAKAKHGRSRAKEKLARLIQDKDLLVLRAPATGTVYYGRCMEGKWSDSESLMRRLSPGGGASPREVLMTIVNMEDVYVRVEVPEKHFPDLRVGMEAPVSVPAAGTEDLNGRLADVSRVPVATGKFAAKVALRARQGERPPVPGVTCKVKPVVYASQDALVVPTSAVGNDEGTGDRYVMLVEKDQPPKKRVVKVGRETEDTVEIREGLSAGDNIVKSVKEGQSA
jgi:multidrug efflux pump subunit AcrA (membrane-fusion protein)